MIHKMSNKERRQYVVVDGDLVQHHSPDAVQTSGIVKHSSINDISSSDDNSGATSTQILDALSLESTTVWERGQLYGSYTFSRFKVKRNNSEIICKQIVDDLVNDIYSAAEREREREEIRKREKAVESYLSRLIPAPLVQRQEVSQMGRTMSTAIGTLKGSSSRLHAAWRIILVSTAQQINLSYSRIVRRMNAALNEELDLLGLPPRTLLTDKQGLLVHLLHERERMHQQLQPQQELAVTEQRESIVFDEELTGYLVPLASRDDDFNPEAIVREFSEATVAELRAVTDRILDLAVLYLKNATRNVVDGAVSDVKSILVTESTHL